VPDFYARKAIEGAKCHGNWSDPRLKPIADSNGPCRSIDSYNYTLDKNGWPLISECNKVAFWKYYTTVESMAIFDAIYTNKHGLTDAFVGFWDRVAQKLANNKYVMGFDPLNEPFAADIEANPDLLQADLFN